MSERYEKKQTYEFCGIRKRMVRLDIIQSTATLPDWVNTEAKLVPVGCNMQDQCKWAGIKCIVFDPNGEDPCPEVWKG